MRLVLRLFIIWLILGSAFYVWGLPYLTDRLSVQTREQQSTLCLGQLRSQNMIPAPINEQAATRYCTCLAEPLQFTVQDIIHLQRTKVLPDPIMAALDAQTAICQPALERAMRGLPPLEPVVKNDGSVEMHL